MRETTPSTLSLLTAIAALAVIRGAQAQQAPPDRPSLPRDVRHEVVDRWNGPSEFRAVNRAEIDERQEIRGDVAVLRGPLVIGGHVTGNVLAINSDVILRPAARIDGSLLVVGGDVEGRGVARVDGSIRIYRQALAYREEGDRIVALAEDGVDDDERWWRRMERHRPSENWHEALRVVQAGPFNRVEGLPIELGPAINARTPWGSMRIDAAAVVRTGSTFESKRGGDVGHNVRAELRVGHRAGIGVGARLFNVVDPVEAWQLSDLETALASFVARRDYRDYFERHGANAYLTLFGARDLSLTGSFGEERWASRTLRNPFTLFNGERPWRDNPSVDEGLFHIGDMALRFDTRTDPEDPWSGWYLSADLEHGSGTVAQAAPQSALVAGSGVDYNRGFFDLRRYNRLGPSSQLNMRVVVGGWLGGGPLPIERRLSVDGPGVMPGFGFREMTAGPNVGSCNDAPIINATAALCDRIALAQIEYRGDLKLDLSGDWEDWPRHYHRAHGGLTWVFFADAGRGWNTTTTTRSFPALSTFRSDVGLGLDIGGIGIYAAKAVSTSHQPVNFFVRLRHRF